MMTPDLPPQRAERQDERSGAVVEHKGVGDTVVDEEGVGADDGVGGEGDGGDEEGVGEERDGAGGEVAEGGGGVVGWGWV